MFYLFAVCLIAGVLLTSKYEIKIVKEKNNGKFLVSRFFFLVWFSSRMKLSVTSHGRLIFDILTSKNERTEKISCDKVVCLWKKTCLHQATACVPHFYFLFYGVCCCLHTSRRLCFEFFLTNVDSTPSSGIDVDEFCPRMDEANLMILKQIGDHADDTGIYSSSKSAGNESDDSDNELLPPKNAVIPEPDDIDAAAEDDSEDLLLDAATVLTQSAEYKRKHFSNTSDSSDSDDSITRGLDFKNIPVTATIEPHSSPSSSTNLLTNIQQALARNLIENIMMPKSSQSNSKAYDSEDEISDFEILDKDDLMK